MESEQKEELLQKFSEYLDSVGGEDEIPGEDDFFGVHTELAGLKNEVQIESRQFKAALDDFRSVFASLENTNELLARQLEESRHREADVAEKHVKVLLISLLDFLERFMEAVARDSPQKTFFSYGLRQRQQQWIAAQREGMLMLQDRLIEITGRHGVSVLNCVGKSFDIRYMQAAGTRFDDQQEEGMVLEQLRPGFLLHGESLRLAEVIVNRKNQELE